MLRCFGFSDVRTLSDHHLGNAVLSLAFRVHGLGLRGLGMRVYGSGD